MIEMQPHDLIFVLARLPKDVRRLLMNNPRRLFLAGGFIRAVVAGETVSDIDLFGDAKDFLIAEADKFASGREGSKTHKTDNAMTVLSTEGRLPVQFITRWIFAAPELLAASFDFTVCKAVVWHDGDHGWKSMCDDRFYIDLAARRLHYTFPVREEEAGGSMMRAIKYIKRGYTIQPDSLGGVISRLADKVRDTDVPSAQVITGLLREVDPLLAVDGLTVLDEVHAH